MVRQVLACLSVASIITAGVAQADDWTQFQGNAAHTGHVSGTFDPLEFRELWSVDAPPYSAGPGDRAVAIDGTRVYATMLEGYGFRGPYHVLGLDLRTGQEHWRNSITANSHSGVSAPTVHGERVYVHHWGHSGSSGSTYPDDYPMLIGLDAIDGDMLFQTTHSGQWSSGSRPTAVGDQVFAAGGYYGGLDAYDGETGANTWFTKVPQQYGWIPAADESYVYVYMGYASASPGPSPGRLYAVHREQGGIDYEILHPGSHHTFYGTLQNVVLGGLGDAFSLTRTPSWDTLLASFDLESQSIRWQLNGAFSGTMAVGNNVIAIPNGDELSFIEQATGNLLWSWQAGADVTGNVLLTDNLAFVSAGGSVHAVDLLQQESVWSAPVSGDLALAHGVLVVSNPSGITAFEVGREAIRVLLDIKPGSDPTSINPLSRGVIPVAILTTANFDALTVDADSVLFGPAETEKRHKRAHVEDVDDDGDLDLLLHFRTQDTGIAIGDTEACVIGQTYDGVPIMGCDSVRTVPPGGSGGSTTASSAGSSTNCGLGAELALLLPPLMWRWRQRRS